jgi:Na+/proline symporter
MSLLLTLLVSVISYATCVFFVLSKLGVAGGSVAWALLSAAPFGVFVLLGVALRKRRKEGWFAFGGTTLCAAMGFHGIYAAFLSDRPHDPWIVMYRPVSQLGLAIIVSLIVGVSYFVSRVRSRGSRAGKQPNQSLQPTAPSGRG